MHILFCNYEYPPLGGGGGIINAALARVLAKRHKVTVLTSRAFDLPKDEMVDGVRVIRAPTYFRRQKASANLASMAFYVITAIFKGILLIRKEKFDIINTHFALPTGPVGYVLSKVGRIPNVLSVHGGDIYDPSKRLSPHRHFFFRFVIQKMVKGADSVVAQSENTRKNVLRLYTDQYPVDLIPLGIDKPPAVTGGPVLRSRLGFSDDDILYVTIGRLVARKQVEQLLDMISSLEAPTAKLVVIGSGPESDRLKVLADKRGISDKVHWTGFVDEDVKQQILQVSDVFVSTSVHEGFGLVFLEAMACGLPVVCYDHGGQTDFLGTSRNGYVVPLNDIKAFTENCRRLASDPALRSEFGRNNLEDVEQFFISQCAKRYEQKFDQVINDHL